MERISNEVDWFSISLKTRSDSLTILQGWEKFRLRHASTCFDRRCARYLSTELPFAERSVYSFCIPVPQFQRSLAKRYHQRELPLSTAYIS